MAGLWVAAGQSTRCCQMLIFFTFINPNFNPQPLDCQLAEAVAEIEFSKRGCHDGTLLLQCVVYLEGFKMTPSELLWLQKSFGHMAF